MFFGLSKTEHNQLRRWDITAISVEILLLVIFFIGLTTGGGAAGERAAMMFLGGKYTAPFWSLVIVAGLAVPLFMELLEGKERYKPTRVAPALLLIGGLALRWLLVTAGQA